MNKKNIALLIALMLMICLFFIEHVIPSFPCELHYMISSLKKFLHKITTEINHSGITLKKFIVLLFVAELILIFILIKIIYTSTIL